MKSMLAVGLVGSVEMLGLNDAASSQPTFGRVVTTFARRVSGCVYTCG